MGETTIGAALAGLAGTIGAYFLARWRHSGSVDTTDARTLWEHMSTRLDVLAADLTQERSKREELQEQVLELRREALAKDRQIAHQEQQIQKQEIRIESLYGEREHLRALVEGMQARMNRAGYDLSDGGMK